MAKWIDYSLDERKALITKVAQAKNIDGAAAEKDWWVTAVLYSVFHTSIADYSLFKGLCVATHKPLNIATSDSLHSESCLSDLQIQ